MTRQFFYFDKFRPFDKWAIGLYLILTTGLSFYFLYTENIAGKRNVIFGYALLTQLALYGFCYKSLRNMTVFAVWIVFGLFHFHIYYYLKDDTTLEMFRGHSATPLRNTIPLLFLYQFLRFVSLKIQSQELVSPTRGLTTDIFNDRKISWLDFILFFVYCGCVIVLD